MFRLIGTSPAEFSTSWHRHAQIVSPWFLSFGLQEYTQIHMPEESSSSIPLEHEAAIQKILRQADGIALVRCVPIKTADGNMLPFGDAEKHPYFSGMIAMDERRFLHVESGATAIKGSPPVFDVPVLAADEWRRMALEAGAVEHVKIKDGEAVIEGLWWDEWKESDGKQAVK